MEDVRDRSFKHFDLPVNHLGWSGHYKPPKAREESEIERRRNLRSGTLLAEYQEKGIKVATAVLDFMRDKDDSTFTPDLLAATGINTAWHNHAQEAKDVMRRRLYLPVHARSDMPVSWESLIADSAEGFEKASIVAGYLATSIEARNSAVPSFKRKLGVQLGNSALVLASVGKVEAINWSRDPEQQQYQARRGALEVLELSRTIGAEMGANPTLAQLADRDSPLSVYIRREGTNTSVEALDYSMTEVLEEAA